MKSLLIGLLAILVSLGKPYDSFGQQITGAEYFINTDPGVGNGIPIPVIALFSIDLNIPIPAAGIPSGFNQLFVRTKDQDGNWSIAGQRTFYIDNSLYTSVPSIISAEYFFDTDPGAGSGIALPVKTGALAENLININASSLADGFHQLLIRVKDQYNNWSFFGQRTFYVDSTLHALVPSLISAEYFFDTDPGVSHGVSLQIKNGDTLNTLYNINIAGLAAGFHQLFIRVNNGDGSWSIAEQRTFLIDSNLNPVPSPLIAGEYYIDIDGGVGNNTSIHITKGSSVDTNYTYTAPNLPVGKYSMNLRVEDSTGNWSIVKSRPFTVCTTYGPISNFSYSISDSLVNFTNNSQYGSTYHWKFGDGDTSNLFKPVHIYKPGTYNACLISKNDCLPAGDTLCNSVVITTSILPLTLLNFQAALSNNVVNCNWQTANEINISYFLVERSKDGINFTNLNKVYTTGNSNTTISYNFTDHSPSEGINYYRLQMVDKDGKFTYSETIPINISLRSSFSVYPNPVKDNLFIQLQRDRAEETVIQILDIQGKTVEQKAVQLAIGTTTISMPTSSLAKDSYFIVVKGQSTQKKIFVKE